VSSDVAHYITTRQLACELHGAVKANGRLDFAVFTYIDERENALFCMFGSAKASAEFQSRLVPRELSTNLE